MKRINVFSVKLVKESSKLYDVETESKICSSPAAAAKIVNEVLGMNELPKEHFVVVCLSTKNTILGVHTVHIGALDASIVHPREVFQLAILNNAHSIICFHNHPSGHTEPSREDIQVTKRLQEAGRIIGINLLDHIIIGHGNRHLSLKEEGHMK